MISEDPEQPPPDQNSGHLREVLHTWRYFFWLLGLGLMVLLFYGEENWRGRLTWERYQARMIAQGEVFSPAAYVPPVVPDEQNFAMTPALAPIFQFIPGTQKWRNPRAPSLFQDLTAQYDAAAGLIKSKPPLRRNSWVRGRTDLNLWAAALDKSAQLKPRPREPLSPARLNSHDAATKVLDALTDFTPLIDELRSASSRPYCRFNLRYEEDNPATILLPHLAQIKRICQILQLRGACHIALGQTDAALQDLELLLYLANSSRNEPILISQLVRLSEVQMALQLVGEGLGAWSEPQLRLIQNHLGQLDFCADLSRALQAERVLFGVGLIEYVRRSHNKVEVLNELTSNGPSGSGNDFWPGPLLAFSPSGWLYFEELNYSRAFDEFLIPVIDEKNHEIKPSATATAEKGLRNLLEGSVTKRFFQHRLFAGLVLPAVSNAALKAAYAQTGAETAEIACTLEAYRILHGNLPDSLDKLSPAQISTLPHDIITGKPLTYRVEPENHYVVYSIGWNETDDGGSVYRNKNGEPDQKEGDWVWSDEF
ncbi:MAG TPA: hypothetical protein VKY92_26090 [Verrucomicrobiae bacterium]|nr:hypothetical protein [Verrucomicrobiae bacterium]